MDLLHALLDADTKDVQMLRFWGAIINACWLGPLGIMALANHEPERWPNGLLALPLTMIFLGIAGFSAVVVWGFEPTPNWRALLSLMMLLGLALFAIMGVLRWCGVRL